MKLIDSYGAKGIFRGPCKGICVRNKAARRPFEKYYIGNHKRCNTCVIFLDWPTWHCPCCGHRLTGRRKNNMKNRLPMAQRANVVTLEYKDGVAVPV